MSREQMIDMLSYGDAEYYKDSRSCPIQVCAESIDNIIKKNHNALFVNFTFIDDDGDEIETMLSWYDVFEALPHIFINGR